MYGSGMDDSRHDILGDVEDVDVDDLVAQSGELQMTLLMGMQRGNIILDSFAEVRRNLGAARKVLQYLEADSTADPSTIECLAGVIREGDELLIGSQGLYDTQVKLRNEYNKRAAVAQPGGNTLTASPREELLPFEEWVRTDGQEFLGLLSKTRSIRVRGNRGQRAQPMKGLFGARRKPAQAPAAPDHSKDEAELQRLETEIERLRDELSDKDKTIKSLERNLDSVRQSLDKYEMELDQKKNQAANDVAIERLRLFAAKEKNLREKYTQLVNEAGAREVGVLGTGGDECTEILLKVPDADVPPPPRIMVWGSMPEIVVTRPDLSVMPELRRPEGITEGAVIGPGNNVHIIIGGKLEGQGEVHQQDADGAAAADANASPSDHMELIRTLTRNLSMKDARAAQAAYDRDQQSIDAERDDLRRMMSRATMARFDSTFGKNARVGAQISEIDRLAASFAPSIPMMNIPCDQVLESDSGSDDESTATRRPAPAARMESDQSFDPYATDDINVLREECVALQGKLRRSEERQEASRQQVQQLKRELADAQAAKARTDAEMLAVETKLTISMDEIERLRGYLVLFIKGLRTFLARQRQSLMEIREALRLGHDDFLEDSNAAIEAIAQHDCGVVQAVADRMRAMYDREVALRRKYAKQVQEAKSTIRVVARVKPMVKNEGQASGLPESSFLTETCVYTNDDEVDTLHQDEVADSVHGTRDKTTTYQFARLLLGDAAQEDVFREVLPSLNTMAADEKHLLVVALGGAGSGKTYTIQGPPESEAATPEEHLQSRGLFTRALDRILRRARAATDGEVTRVHMAVTEVFNEHVYDLLQSKREQRVHGEGEGGQGLRIVSEGKTQVGGAVVRGPVVDGQRAVLVKSVADGEVLLAKAASRAERGVGAHLMVTLYLITENTELQSQRVTLLRFLELAAMAKDDAGLARHEAIRLNKSLKAFHRMLASMQAGKRVASHRDSTLTHLVRDSVTGNSSVILFAHCDSHPLAHADTKHTLKVSNATMKMSMSERSHAKQQRSGSWRKAGRRRSVSPPTEAAAAGMVSPTDGRRMSPRASIDWGAVGGRRASAAQGRKVPFGLLASDGAKDADTEPKSPPARGASFVGSQSSTPRHMTPPSQHVTPPERSIERRNSIDRADNIERRHSLQRRSSIERRHSLERRSSIERASSMDRRSSIERAGSMGRRSSSFKRRSYSQPLTPPEQNIAASTATPTRRPSEHRMEARGGTDSAGVTSPTCVPSSGQSHSALTPASIPTVSLSELSRSFNEQLSNVRHEGSQRRDSTRRSKESGGHTSAKSKGSATGHLRRSRSGSSGVFRREERRAPQTARAGSSGAEWREGPRSANTERQKQPAIPHGMRGVTDDHARPRSRRKRKVEVPAPKGHYFSRPSDRLLMREAGLIKDHKGLRSLSPATDKGDLAMPRRPVAFVGTHGTSPEWARTRSASPLGAAKRTWLGTDSPLRTGAPDVALPMRPGARVVNTSPAAAGTENDDVTVEARDAAEVQV